MATKTVKAANDVARKGLAVVLAALLCMPMTGLEYPAYADAAAPDVVAGQDQSAQPQENEALTPSSSSKEESSADDASGSVEPEGDVSAGDASQEEALEQGEALAEEDAAPSGASGAQPSMNDAPLADAARGEDIGHPADIQLQVTGAPSTGGDESNAYLVRAGEAPPVITTPIELKIVQGESIGSWTNRVVVNLYAPYLYIGADGESHQTLRESEWKQNGGDVSGTRLSLIPSANMEGHWEVYSVDEHGNKHEIKKDTPEWTEGLSGNIRLEYVNNEGVLPGGVKPQIPEFTARFKGHVPENTMAEVGVGMHVGLYTDSNEVQHEGDFTIRPGDSTDSQIRSAILVNSNLEWDFSTKCISDNALWDRVNYMVYEVHMKNTSKTTQSEIYSAAFDLYSEVKQSNGLRQEDLAAFKLENGQVVENPNPSDSSATLVGKPGEGGALIYDVTNMDPKLRDEIDLVRFSNVDELGLEELPYRSLQPGHVNIDLPHENADGTPGSGHLVSKGDPDNPDDQNPSNHDETVLYVALPFTTNFVPHDQGDGTSIFEQIKVENTPTVYFSTNGAISWSKKPQIITSAFQVPEVGLTLQKHALDFSDAPQKRTNGALGYVSHYAISDIAASGNVPIFGPDSLEQPYGAVMTDMLPNDFDLTSIDITMDKQTVEGLPERALSDWLATGLPDGASCIQFETKAEGSDASTWVSVGDPVALGEGADGKLHWKLGSDEAGSALYEDGKLAAFTGKFRVLFKDALSPDGAFPGNFNVNGIMTLPHNEYRNDAQLAYAMKQWVPSVAGKPGHYSLLPKETTSSATLLPAGIAPQMQSNAFEGTPEDIWQKAPDIAVPLGRKSGYIFDLSNASRSAIMPAYFKTSPLEFKTNTYGEKYGFISEGVVVSKGLIDHAEGLTLKIHTDEGHTYTYSDNDIMNRVGEDGSAVIDRSDFDGMTLSSIEFYMESFDGNMAAADGASIGISGAVNCIGEFTLTSEFGSNYAEEFEEKNRFVKGIATLRTHAPSPYVRAVAFSNSDDSSVQEGSQIEVPLSDRSGYRFEFSNYSSSVMAPAHFKASGLEFKEDSKGGKFGFEADQISLSPDLLDCSTNLRLTVTTAEGGLYEFDNQEIMSLVGDDGRAVIANSKFGDGCLSGIEIFMDSFNGDVNSSSMKAFVEVSGTTTCVGDYDFKGIFETMYDPALGSQNVQSSSTARISVQQPVPYLEEVSFKRLSDGTDVESVNSGVPLGGKGGGIVLRCPIVMGRSWLLRISKPTDCSSRKICLVKKSDSRLSKSPFPPIS